METSNQRQNEVAVARKLLETLHVSVEERRIFDRNAVRFSVLVEGARIALEEHPWLPPKLRPDGHFDGTLIERRGTTYVVHERHEIGVGRFSDVRSSVKPSIEEAVREYVMSFRNSVIDGIRIDFDI